MVHVLEHLNVWDLASTDLRKRLLETAFAWLEATEEDSLHHVLPATELAQVSDKCGRIAAKLEFAVLGELYGQSPRGFHKLMSLDAFLPSLTALEGLRKVHRCVACMVLCLCVLGCVGVCGRPSIETERAFIPPPLYATRQVQPLPGHRALLR